MTEHGSTNTHLPYGYMCWEVLVYMIIVCLSAVVSHLTGPAIASLYVVHPSYQCVNVFATALTCFLINVLTLHWMNWFEILTPKCFLTPRSKLLTSKLQTVGCYIASIFVSGSLLVQIVVFSLQMSSPPGPWQRDLVFLFSLYTSAYILVRLSFFYQTVEWTARAHAELERIWNSPSCMELFKMNLILWGYELLIYSLIMLQMTGLGILGILLIAEEEDIEYFWKLSGIAATVGVIVVCILVMVIVEEWLPLLSYLTRNTSHYIRVSRWKARRWICYVLLQFLSFAYFRDPRELARSGSVQLLNNLLHVGLIGFLWMTMVKDALIHNSVRNARVESAESRSKQLSSILSAVKEC